MLYVCFQFLCSNPWFPHISGERACKGTQKCKYVAFLNKICNPARLVHWSIPKSTERSTSLKANIAESVEHNLQGLAKTTHVPWTPPRLQKPWELRMLFCTLDGKPSKPHQTHLKADWTRSKKSARFLCPGTKNGLLPTNAHDFQVGARPKIYIYI